jgi:hypothetical protein
MGCHILDDGFYIWTLHNALTQVPSSLISAPTYYYYYYYYSTMHLCQGIPYSLTLSSHWQYVYE